MTDSTELNFSDYIDAELSRLVRVPTKADAADLKRLWAHLYPQSTAGSDEGFDAMQEALVSALRAEETAELEFRPGGWELDLRSGIVKSALTAALLTGVLIAAGATGLAPVVLPTVLPMLLDINRVKISPRDRFVHAALRKVSPDGKPMTAQELYDGLPGDLRDVVSPLDFAEFIDHLTRAGYVTASSSNVIVHPDDEPRFRISLD